MGLTRVSLMGKEAHAGLTYSVRPGRYVLTMTRERLRKEVPEKTESAAR